LIHFALSADVNMLDNISRRKMTRRGMSILSAIAADVTMLDNTSFSGDMKMLTILMYKTASLHMTVGALPGYSEVVQMLTSFSFPSCSD